MSKIIALYRWGTDFSLITPAQRLRWLDEQLAIAIQRWDERETWVIGIGDPLMLARLRRHIAEGKIDYREVVVQMPTELDEAKTVRYAVDEEGYIIGFDVYDAAMRKERSAIHDAHEARKQCEIKTDPHKMPRFEIEADHVVIYQDGNRIGSLKPTSLGSMEKRDALFTLLLAGTCLHEFDAHYNHESELGTLTIHMQGETRVKPYTWYVSSDNMDWELVELLEYWLS